MCWSRLSVMVVAGLLIVPVAHEAAAAPVTAATPRITPAVVDGGSITKIYYYHGRYYPYYYHGAYYPYRYGGHYYQHRYYRYGHWHYY